VIKKRKQVRENLLSGVLVWEGVAVPNRRISSQGETCLDMCIVAESGS
jgi:hypothetical protein